jgi:hypothetical protein
MTTAASLVKDAYREGNLIPVGSTPTTDEQIEALERLNRYVQGVFGYEMGEPLVDWDVPDPQRTAPVAADFPQAPIPHDMPSGVYPYPPKNRRIVFGSVAQTVYFPEAPLDGSRMALVQGSGVDGTPGSTVTLDGNGRTIEGSNTKAYTAPVTARQWLYRADLADWQAVVDMTLTNECPFPPELDDLWICMLAMRLAPRYGKTTAPETSRLGLVMLAKLKTRYEQAGCTIYGSSDFPHSLQSYMDSSSWLR